MTNTLVNTYQLSRYNFYKLLYKEDYNKLKLDEDNLKHLKEYLAGNNIQSMILKLVNDFKEAFTKKDDECLNSWIQKYKQLTEYTSLQTFIKGVMNDKQAIVNQITNSITNGTTEGLVGKLKVIKRRTYGRSSFELLKCLLL